MSKKLQTVYVHAANGGVWVSRNTEPESFCSTAPITLARELSSTADRVCLLGSATNAHILDELYRRQVDVGGLPPISICTPQIIGTDARSTFANMRAMNLAGSLGGFHELSDSDGPGYRLINSARSSGGKMTAETAALLREHRAWPALSFIKDLDDGYAAQFLCDVIDPRWFVSTKEPNSTKKLFGYLGLTPRNIENALAGRTPSCRQARRCETVLNAWLPGRCGGDLADSGRFLQRVVASTDPDHKIKGYLRASRLFVDFVRGVWLDMMTPRHRLFVPKFFFKQHDDVVAFAKHRDEYACWKSV